MGITSIKIFDFLKSIAVVAGLEDLKFVFGPDEELSGWHFLGEH